MRASGERNPDQRHGRGGKRPKVNRSRADVSVQQQSASANLPSIPGLSQPGATFPSIPGLSQQSANAPSTQSTRTKNMTPVLMSFEARIGLALKGSSWQELQSNSNVPPIANNKTTLQEGATVDVEDEQGDTDKPREMTAKQKKKKAVFDRVIARDAGSLIHTIGIESVAPVQQAVTWDQDPELLCCYNWQASTDDTNTIFVPGEPAKWQPPTLPHTLEQDTGFQYADYNYARQPRTPYEPMFRALSVMNPDYQFIDVDVLADRNNLRVLLEFVQGKANGPFRLDLYTIFNTLVIVRNESKWWKLSNGQSYGCNFERFFTRPADGMEDATSHYRAIRYPMGPLNVVCRFEADAYDDGVIPDNLTLTETDAVSGGLAERPKFQFNAPIRVLQKGHIVPTTQIVELKTKAYREDLRDMGLVQCQDQLWFGRTSLLYTGPYESGTGIVSRVKYEDATQRVKSWEEKNQESLRKLAGLLTLLKTVVKRQPGNRGVVLVREDKAGPLSVRAMESINRAVKKEAFERHWRRAPMQPGGPQYGGPQHSGAQRGGAPLRGGNTNRRGGRGAHFALGSRGQS